jgi:beta-lactamase regulating signal transducer with metallopeptidase domain
MCVVGAFLLGSFLFSQFLFFVKGGMAVKKMVQALSAFMLALVAVVGLSLTDPKPAEATSSNPSPYLQKSGIKVQKNSTAGQNEIAQDAQQIMNVLYIVSGFWILACFIFAGLKLSAAQGNPQNRTQGLVGLAFAGVGAIVVFQAQQIAGYIASLGM